MQKKLTILSIIKSLGILLAIPGLILVLLGQLYYVQLIFIIEGALHLLWVALNPKLPKKGWTVQSVQSCCTFGLVIICGAVFWLFFHEFLS